VGTLRQSVFDKGLTPRKDVALGATVQRIEAETCADAAYSRRVKLLSPTWNIIYPNNRRMLDVLIKIKLSLMTWES